MGWVVVLFGMLAAVHMQGQSLNVYSEFARIDRDGRVTLPESPREILSPAIARNAFTSFQIVVDVPKGTPYWLYVGLNPEDSVRVTLYHEDGDKLEPVEQPFHSDSTQTLWLDLWTDGSAPVRRIKVEPELNIPESGKDEWMRYPMEVRVVDATVPAARFPAGFAAPVVMMRNYVCGTETASGTDTASARLHFRNAQQDLALAARIPKEELRRMLGGCEGKMPENPEWYLGIRDYLFRMR